MVKVNHGIRVICLFMFETWQLFYHLSTHSLTTWIDDDQTKGEAVVNERNERRTDINNTKRCFSATYKFWYHHHLNEYLLFQPAFHRQLFLFFIQNLFLLSIELFLWSLEAKLENGPLRTNSYISRNNCTCDENWCLLS